MKMKKKYLNLLIIMFTFCLMFINIEEVKAEEVGRCFYIDDEGYEATVKFYGDEYFSIGMGGWSDIGPGNYAKEGETYPFQFENDVYYCPKEVYIRYVSFDSNYGITTYTLDFIHKEVEGNEKSGRKLSLDWNTGSTVEYNADTDEDGNFKACKHGGNTEISKLEVKLSGLKSDVEGLSSDLDNAKEKDVIAKSDEITALAEELSKLEEYCSFYGSETKLGDDFEILVSDVKEIKEYMDESGKLSNENAEIIQDNLDDASNMISDFEFKLKVSNKQYSCEGLIADELEAVIQFVLKIVRIGAPIVLIILCAIDFSQAVISNDQDTLKKATSKVIKRLIAALGLFLVPLFVSVAIDWVEDSYYFNKENANCTEVYK